ncbi:MAG: HepT-like ribonuclease domain-containing protein [bacterium]
METFVQGMDFSEFVHDDKTSSAVVRKPEIIGEAAKNIPSYIRQRYKELPWAEMAKTRDKIIHFYFGVDYEIIWKVIIL